jgi:hypothetical protein
MDFDCEVLARDISKTNPISERDSKGFASEFKLLLLLATSCVMKMANQIPLAQATTHESLSHPLIVQKYGPRDQ